MPGRDLAAGRQRSTFDADQRGVVGMFKQDGAHPLLPGLAKGLARGRVGLRRQRLLHQRWQCWGARHRARVVRQLDAVPAVQPRRFAASAFAVRAGAAPGGAAAAAAARLRQRLECFHRPLERFVEQRTCGG